MSLLLILQLIPPQHHASLWYFNFSTTLLLLYLFLWRFVLSQTPNCCNSPPPSTNLRSSVVFWKFSNMKGECVPGPERKQTEVGLTPIQCNPANLGVGWPYPAQVASHFRNALPRQVEQLPRTFTALSAWHADTNTSEESYPDVSMLQCWIKVLLNVITSYSGHGSGRKQDLYRYRTMWMAEYELQNELPSVMCVCENNWWMGITDFALVLCRLEFQICSLNLPVIYRPSQSCMRFSF